jgi:hypothetical protein
VVRSPALTMPDLPSTARSATRPRVTCANYRTRPNRSV